jgi:hypothetical protein
MANEKILEVVRNEGFVLVEKLRGHCGASDAAFNSLVQYAQALDTALMLESCWVYVGEQGFDGEAVASVALNKALVDKFRKMQPSLCELGACAEDRQRRRRAHFEPLITAEAERVKEQELIRKLQKSTKTDGSNMSRFITCRAPPFDERSACEDAADDEARYKLALDICRLFYEPIHVAVMAALKHAFSDAPDIKPLAKRPKCSNGSNGANKPCTEARAKTALQALKLDKPEAIEFLQEQMLLKRTEKGYRATLDKFLDACVLKMRGIVQDHPASSKFVDALEARASESLRNKLHDSPV